MEPIERLLGMPVGAYKAYLFACEMSNLEPQQITIEIPDYIIREHAENPERYTGRIDGVEQRLYCTYDISFSEPDVLNNSEKCNLLLSLLMNGFAPRWMLSDEELTGDYISAIWTRGKMTPTESNAVRQFIADREQIVCYMDRRVWVGFVEERAWVTIAEAMLKASCWWAKQ